MCGYFCIGFIDFMWFIDFMLKRKSFVRLYYFVFLLRIWEEWQNNAFFWLFSVSVVVKKNQEESIEILKSLALIKNMSKENISQEFTSKEIDKIKNDFIID